MRRKLTALALLCAVLFVMGWTLRPVVATYEYKAVGTPRDLNKLGSEGWELVAIDSTSAGGVFYLKRAK